MRYSELLEARPWRRYSGTEQSCRILHIDGSGSLGGLVQFGSVTTGRQRVWVGWFVQVIDDAGREWFAENAHSLRRALRRVEAKLNNDGLSLAVIGLDREWRESGLSANSGWGYHPDFDEAVHMLQPLLGH